MSSIGELINASRTNRGLTQEKAVQLLPVELRTYQSYENGERKIPIDLLSVISKAFNDKFLYFECMQELPGWKEFFPSIQRRDLSDAAINLLDAIAALKDRERKIIHIVKDKKISTEERPEWRETKKDMLILLGAIIELLAADEGEFDDEILKGLEG